LENLVRQNGVKTVKLLFFEKSLVFKKVQKYFLNLSKFSFLKSFDKPKKPFLNILGVVKPKTLSPLFLDFKIVFSDYLIKKTPISNLGKFSPPKWGENGEIAFF
jgi:hypothetical protein